MVDGPVFPSPCDEKGGREAKGEGPLLGRDRAGAARQPPRARGAGQAGDSPAARASRFAFHSQYQAIQTAIS